jgi:hypothetical protein
MNFQIRQTFPCQPRVLWDITFAPDFDQRLEAHSGVRREVLERRGDDANLYIKRRVIILRDSLPRTIAKAVGTDRISYVQEYWIDVASSSARWQVTPDVMASKIKASGTETVLPGREGCNRLAEGMVSVDLPVVGAAMEKRVVRMLTTSFDRAAELIRTIIRERAA